MQCFLSVSSFVPYSCVMVQSGDLGNSGVNAYLQIQETGPAYSTVIQNRREERLMF